MKKLIIALLCISLVAVCFAGCKSSKSEETGFEIDTSTQSDTIIQEGTTETLSSEEGTVEGESSSETAGGDTETKDGREEIENNEETSPDDKPTESGEENSEEPHQ